MFETIENKTDAEILAALLGPITSAGVVYVTADKMEKAMIAAYRMGESRHSMDQIDAHLEASKC